MSLLNNDWTEFRTLLRKAIGPDRSQAEFAKATKIAPATLSRLLNQPEIPQPSVETLKKIAGNAFGGITLKELMDSCGYDQKRVDKELHTVKNNALLERKKLSPPERAKKCMEDFRNGVTSLLRQTAVYKSVYDFVDTVNMLYGVEQVSIDLGYYMDTDRNGAENADIVTISFSDTDFSMEGAFILFYCKTTRGSVIFLDSAFDPETLLKYGSKIAVEMEEISYTDPEVTIGDFTTLIKYKNKVPNTSNPEANARFFQRVRNIMEEKGVKREEAFLIALFGDEDKPKRISTVEGIGFYIDRIPEYLVKQFIRNHKESFCISDKEKEIYRRLQDENENLSIFYDKNYSTENGAGTFHWGCAICNIISRETDINLDLWEDDDDLYPYENRPCIVFSESHPWSLTETEKQLSRNTLIQILDRYAIELQAEIDDDIYFVMDLVI